MNKAGVGYGANNRRMLNDPINCRYGADDEETNLHSYETVNPMTARRVFREPYPQSKDPHRPLKGGSSRAVNDRWDVRGERVQAFSRDAREPYYGASPSYGYGLPANNHHDAYGPNGVENLEQDRAELLRKLDELNVQISRSKEPEQRFPIDRNMVPSGRYNARFMDYNGPAPSAARYDMEVPNVPVLPGHFRDPFGPKIAGTSGKYVHHSSGEGRAFPEEPMEYTDPELFELYWRDRFRRKPPSSKMSLEDPFDPHISPVRVRPKVANLGSSDSFGFHSQDQAQNRGRSSNSSDNSGALGRVSPIMGSASKESRKHHLAIAGGAPFIICSNCFSLLKLPRKLRTKGEIAERTRCGSCSALIHIELDEKRLTTHAVKDSPDEANNKALSEISNDGGHDRSSSLGLSDYGGINSKQNFSWKKTEENPFSREQDVDMGRNEKIRGFNSSISSYSGEDEEAEEEINRDPKGLIIGRDDHTSPARPSLPLEKTPQKSTPMIAYENQGKNENSDYINQEKAFLQRSIGRDDYTSSARPSLPPEKCAQKSAPMVAYENQGKNEKSSDYMNQEKAFLQKSNSPHGSFSDDPDMTEVEVSASEYPITCTSQDSMDTSREEDYPNNKKGGGRSFFKGLMKRSTREQLKPEPIIENERHEVTVNGNPIPDSVVKQVEVQAGPILPGDYWYDYNSGFWGVVKNPCLGIIPPFIEEFNYPLPTNCSAGNTGIFVNGRQLHQHDLKLLSSRGLPTTRNQFYLINIFGKVIDEDTGEELYNLGQLAPTVVKAGRGFGMRVPKGMM